MQEFGRIVVAGCGRMGLPMARALRAAGFNAGGHDVRPSPAFDDFAGHMVDAAAMQQADILITVVRDAAETDALLFGAQAALSGRVRTLIVSSTLSPRFVTALRGSVPNHIHLIDAPMSGAQIAAEERRLSFMLGGDAALLDRMQPLFAAMGTKFHRMGAFGAGMAAKVLNNYVAATNVATTRRVLDWATGLGLDRAKLLALMHDSSGQNWFASQFEQIEFARDGFAPDNTIAILPKDVAAALDGAGAPDDPVGQAVMAYLKTLTPME